MKIDAEHRIECERAYRDDLRCLERFYARGEENDGVEETLHAQLDASRAQFLEAVKPAASDRQPAT